VRKEGGKKEEREREREREREGRKNGEKSRVNDGGATTTRRQARFVPKQSAI
jgi:hypothetical protein